MDENSTLNTSEFGDNHSKIQLVNFTIDDGDYIGDSDYGHGTHISGILACKDINQNLTANPPSYTTTSPSYESKIIFQDIVNESGWSPPDIDELLSESAINGGYIHSNSWGMQLQHTQKDQQLSMLGQESFLGPLHSSHREIMVELC